MEWLDDFVLRSFLAGLLMVIIAAPMGCLMVWQRMTFLSDTLGHAAVLGIGISIGLQVHPMLGVLAIVLCIVLALSRVSRFNQALPETTLAIISHSGLAAGLILLGTMPDQNISLESILFGDLLATTRYDLILIFVTVGILLYLLIRYWRAFVAVSVSHEIAQAEGIPVKNIQRLMYLMIVLLIVVMMKVMGVLLIAAALVIPTSCARLVGQSPEQMIGFSALFGIASLVGGMASSFHFDWQTGPAIVLSASLLLGLTLLLRQLLQLRHQ